MTVCIQNVFDNQVMLGNKLIQYSLFCRIVATRINNGRFPCFVIDYVRIFLKGIECKRMNRHKNSDATPKLP